MYMNEKEFRLTGNYHKNFKSIDIEVRGDLSFLILRLLVMLECTQHNLLYNCPVGKCQLVSEMFDRLVEIEFKLYIRFSPYTNTGRQTENVEVGIHT